MKNPPFIKLTNRVAAPALAALIFHPLCLSAAVTAVDDGSAGMPFASTSEDVAIIGGASVTSNDIGIFDVQATTVISANGVRVGIENSSGTIGLFNYDPSLNGDAQALGGAQSLEDTFEYTIIEILTPTAGITEELNSSSQVNTMGWATLPALAAPTGSSIPSSFTQVYEFPGGAAGVNRATRNDFQQQGVYDTSDATFEFWIKPDVLQNCTLIETGGSGVGSGVFLNADGTIKFVIKSVSRLELNSVTALTAGQWHQVVVTYDRDKSGTNDEMAIFIDGTADASDATQTGLDDWSGTDNAGLGGENGDTGGDTANQASGGVLQTAGYDMSFNGQMAIVRLYSNKVLTGAEVLVNYNAVSPPTDTATVTIGVSGVNDAPGATNDFLADGPLEHGTYTSTANLLLNDGLAGANIRNLARADIPGMTITQSPSTGTPSGGGVPTRAIDGVINNFTHTDASNNTVDHVLELDFNVDVSVEVVTAINRQDCCGLRFRDITITVQDAAGAVIASSGLLNAGNVLGFATGGELSYDFAANNGGNPVVGQKVVVTRTPDLGDANVGNGSILSVAELIVLGSTDAPGRTLHLNYDARETAGNGLWENRGAIGGSAVDWVLGTGVTLNSSVTSSHSQITAAYEWDGTSNATALFAGDSSINNILGLPVDQEDVTLESWLKLGTADLSQIVTVFETGGGTGFGLVIDNGVLKAGTETDGDTNTGSVVSYDLLADSLNVLGGNAMTAEFFQVAAALTPGRGISLYVNGHIVDQSTGGSLTDWDGGDGAGLGRFGGSNVGGFVSPAAATSYDTFFNGSMAAFRIYGVAMNEAEIRESYEAVANGTDIDGDTIVLDGVIDASGSLVGVGTQATLPSGALVTLTNSTGGFVYDTNGAFSLIPGSSARDSFTYQVSDGNGGIGQAYVSLPITPEADILNDSLTAKESEMKVFYANAFMGNDEFISSAVPGAYISFTPPYASGAVWTDFGSRASNAVIDGSVILPQELESNFGPIGAGVTSATFATLDAISANDVTFEIWFKPDAGQTGKRTIFETGGNGIGFSIVYDPAAGSVIATIDGNNNLTQVLQTSTTGVRTDEVNQLFVTIDINGGAEVGGVGTGVFEDIISIYLNNDPSIAFDATIDGTATSAVGDINDWSGTDAAAFCRVNGTSALDENFPGMAGVVSAFRVYQGLLTPTEMEANFDNYAQSLSSVTSPSDVQGASVTLNADGSVTVDYSGVSLTPGQTVSDSFAYTSSAGTANVDVTIEGYSILEDWRISFGLAPDGSQSGSDSDGLDELFEFAFGTNPNANDNNPLSVGSPASFTPGTQVVSLIPPFNPSNVTARFVRRTDAAAAGLTYVPEFSADLSNWEVDSSNPVPVVISTQAGDYEVVEVPYLVFLSDGQKASFFRMRVNSTGSGEVSP